MQQSTVIQKASADTSQRVRGHHKKSLWTPHEDSMDTSRRVCRIAVKDLWIKCREFEWLASWESLRPFLWCMQDGGVINLLRTPQTTHTMLSTGICCPTHGHTYMQYWLQIYLYTSLAADGAEPRRRTSGDWNITWGRKGARAHTHTVEVLTFFGWRNTVFYNTAAPSVQ